MTSRQRVIAAVEFKGPDRVPHQHRFLPAAFLAASEIEPNQPWENIAAILETFYDYGEYPFKLKWDSNTKQAVEI